MHGGAEPVGRVTIELGLGVEGLDGALEVLGADAEGADVVRHVLGSLGAVHADEVGLGLPDGGGVLRASGRGGVENCLDDLAAVAHVLSVRRAHCLQDLGPVGLVAFAPVLAQGLVRGVSLAAAGVVADVCLRVGGLFPAHAVHYVGARGHGLGLERLRLEGGGHLARNDSGQPVRHGDGLY